MLSLRLVRLSTLMAQTAGHPEVRVGLIDGPVRADHPGLDLTRICMLNGSAGCGRAESFACVHGTFVAGILHARRGGAAPALCPGCSLIIRPIFSERSGGIPTAKANELAAAIVECVDAGARLLNLSVGVLQASHAEERGLEEALDHAGRRAVIVVAASGNQGSVGGSALVRHSAVIPVVAAGENGRIIDVSNLGRSIGRRGLAAPGESVESLSPDGGTRRFGGTSAAAPFVTGTAALLWSLYPAAPAAHVRQAMTRAAGGRRTSIVPPLLDAQAAWDALRTA